MADQVVQSITYGPEGIDHSCMNDPFLARDHGHPPGNVVERGGVPVVWDPDALPKHRPKPPKAHPGPDDEAEPSKAVDEPTEGVEDTLGDGWPRHTGSGSTDT